MHQHQYSASPVDQEALTALKVKLSEMEVANRFETKDLKQKLAEFEDMYLSQFRELGKRNRILKFYLQLIP